MLHSYQTATSALPLFFIHLVYYKFLKIAIVKQKNRNNKQKLSKFIVLFDYTFTKFIIVRFLR